MLGNAGWFGGPWMGPSSTSNKVNDADPKDTYPRYVKVGSFLGKVAIIEIQTGNPLQFVTSGEAERLAAQWETYFIHQVEKHNRG